MSELHPPYKSPTEVAPGIYLVPIPIPIPLKYVNCYLCQGPSGWTLVDTGFHDALAADAWPRAFAELGIRAQDIDRILLTHYHPDHLGAAGWLQQLTGAPAFLHEPELRQVELFWGQGLTVQAQALHEFFAAAGMPEETAAAIARHHLVQWENVQPLAQMQPIPTGSRFRVGAVEYEVLWLPGHSDGLAVFWDANSGILIANDMILDKITPNVSLWPDCRPNPLEDYLASLAKVEALGARLALPGHRNIITDVSGRAAAIRQHHAERLDQMEAACGRAGATAWEVCEQVFTPATLTIHQVRFAMSETLAHLVYMEKQGRLVRRGMQFHS
ncbi:MAG TPA: MBL fold metallo-hydrolase [Symbiobacteriaceae bacterium]|nr:MBL fold metallo-hydrolase [Symbiobacteriaceae bacterium]